MGISDAFGRMIFAILLIDLWTFSCVNADSEISMRSCKLLRRIFLYPMTVAGDSTESFTFYVSIYGLPHRHCGRAFLFLDHTSFDGQRLCMSHLWIIVHHRDAAALNHNLTAPGPGWQLSRLGARSFSAFFLAFSMSIIDISLHFDTIEGQSSSTDSAPRFPAQVPVNLGGDFYCAFSTLQFLRSVFNGCFQIGETAIDNIHIILIRHTSKNLFLPFGQKIKFGGNLCIKEDLHPLSSLVQNLLLLLL